MPRALLPFTILPMNNSPQRPECPNYGLDAPGVVRSLMIAGVGGLLVAAAALTFGAGTPLGMALVWMGACAGLSLAATGCAMIYSSKVGKLRARERWLDLIAWRGDEQVLDVGCGRGLMLVGAAKRLKTGKAVGIDIWQTEDLSGNHSEATIENARREGVAERVKVQTADMRQIPFPDHSFDVILSCNAVHNLYEAAQRDQAVAELARVLKPGGTALIIDIRHISDYAASLVKHGCPEVRQIGSALKALVASLCTLGSLRPGVLLARKAAAA